MTKRQTSIGNTGVDIDLRDLADCLEDELFVVDREYRVQFANSAVLQRLPETVPTLVGRLCYEALEARETPCNAPLWLCPLPKVLQTGNPAVILHPTGYSSVDGAPHRYVKVTVHALRDQHGDIYAVAEMRRDVTAERELEGQVVRRHHHLHVLSRISTAVSELRDLDTILNVSLDAALEIVNGEIGGILLFDSQNQSLSYRVYRGLSAKYAEKVHIKVGEGVAGRVARTSESILLEDVSKDQRVAYRDLVSTEGLKGFASVPLKTEDKVVGVLNIASHMPGRFTQDDLYLLNSIGHQIGTAIEQARLYELLAGATERYRELLRHALTAQEEERKRIARELHDETSQAITSLSLSLQAIIGMAEIIGVEDAGFMEKLKKAHSYAVHAGNEIVKLMKELRPTLLDEIGMPAAIRRYAKDTLEARGVDVSTEFIGMEERLQPEVEVSLFRIAQGAIGNILEHSEATDASIRLECNANECTLQVQDNGKGFDVEKLTRVDPSGRGAGLFTMKERVRLVGGYCRVESQPGQGTRVVVKIPVDRDVGDEEDKGTNSR